jgi:periplasmic protein TonB
MASPDSRIVPISELRFRPANSNDRARAGMEHAFNDVPQCSFAKDDGISPYIGADAGIDGFPDNPATHEPIHDDVPIVAQDGAAPALSLGHKLLRSGFGLSVFLHGLFAIGIGYATIKLPNDDTLLEGETVIAIEFFSETDSEVTTRVKQEEQDGKEEAEETPVEQPKEEPKAAQPRTEPKKEVVEPVKPVEEPKPVEQAKLPEPVEKPVEDPIERPVATDQPEVLSTTEPSSFQIDAAAQQILQETEIEPLPDSPPPMLIMPVEERKPEPEKKLAQPLRHPVSTPRVAQKVAEMKPAVQKEEAKSAEKKKPEPKKEQPKKKEEAKKPEPKPEKKEKKKKKTEARDGNAETASNKGSSKADKTRKGDSQDASQGNSRKKVKGNASTSNYKGLVQRKLERAKKRVRVAAKGTVIVSFTISANGSVVNLRVRKSSGKPAIDKGALDIVRRASPFPAIPPETGLKSYLVSVPMTFKGN